MLYIVGLFEQQSLPQSDANRGLNDPMLNWTRRRLALIEHEKPPDEITNGLIFVVNFAHAAAASR